MSILDYWVSHHQPRQSQITALKWLEDNQDKDFFVMDLPVGVGKSFIGTTFANYLHKTKTDSFKTSFIITPQKILQEQYVKSFVHNEKFNADVLYGKSNYNCNAKNTNCEIGGLLKPKCGTNCAHACARLNAKNTHHIILNYKLALTSFNYTNIFNKRRLMILDECHNLETNLIDFSSITFNKKRCEKYKISWPVVKESTNFNEMFEWIENEYIPIMNDIISQLMDECDEFISREQLSKDEINKIKQMQQLSEHIETVNTLISDGVHHAQSKYVITKDENSIKIKQLYGAENFNNFLYPMADKFLFMSSTIFDYKLFCKNLGIPIDKVAYLALPSEFPAENRPVHYIPTMRMNYQWKDAKNEPNRQQFITKVTDILNDHKHDSGIIHTGNYQIAEWLVKELAKNKTHNVLHHNNGTEIPRDVIIKAFQQTEHPSILISPSLTEGLDLCDDLARFCIFSKIPFGNLVDQWIKKRMTISKKWYFLESLKDVVQGCGRVVRTPDDYGKVYILDESWGYLFNNIKYSIPQWWMDAYKQCK